MKLKSSTSLSMGSAWITICVASWSSFASSPSVLSQVEQAGGRTEKAQVLRPSQYYDSLGKTDAGRKDRKNFIRQLAIRGFSLIPVELRQQILEGSFGSQGGFVFPPEVTKALGQDFSSDALAADTITHWLQGVLEKPQGKHFLDHFPTIPIELVKAAQEGLFKNGHLHLGSLPDPIPFKLEYAPGWDNVSLLRSGCESGSPVRTVVLENPQIWTGTEVSTPYAVDSDCFRKNSLALAQLLNQLSNARYGRSVEAKVGVEGQPQALIKDFATLLTELKRNGFGIELFNRRVFVDFLGFHAKDEQGRSSSLQFATRISLPSETGVGRLVLPAEHGEIGLILKKDGLRWAELFWFFGVPDARNRGVAAFWRPNTQLRSPWAGEFTEIHRDYEGERLLGALPWLEATADVMRGFQAVYDRYETPLNGYGAFICNDSMVFAVARLALLSTEPELREARTNSFPRIYATQIPTRIFPVASPVTLDALSLGDISGLFERYAGFGHGDLSRSYPSDPSAPLEGPGSSAEYWRTRVGLAFRAEQDSRLAFFNEELQELRKRR